MAALRAGGIEPLPKNLKAEARVARVRSDYVAFLQKNGENTEAEWFRRETAAAKATKDVLAQSTDVGIFGTGALTAITHWWSVGQVLLLNTLWVLLLGGLAAWLSRSQSAKEPQPLSPAVKEGIAAAFFLPPVLYAVHYQMDDVSRMLAYSILALVFLFTLGAAIRARYQIRQGKTVRWLPRLVTATRAASVTLFLMLGAWLSIAGLRVLQTQSQMLSGALEAGTTETGIVSVLLPVSLAFAVPLLMALCFAAGAVIRKVPASVRLSDGFRRCTLPVAATLLLAFAGQVIATAVMEKQRRGEYAEMLRHEPRYIADLIGKTLPGFVAEP
jgi:hypothetical protein